MADSELERLVVAARRRPLEDALLIRRGARVGQLGAAIEPERVAELIAVGNQRALIYRTMVLTGLRLNEITTLSNNSFSFGNVPFIRLDVANEKNRDGNSIPLRSDRASELQ